MWSNLPFDLLANVFSYLSPDSVARARAVSRNWRATADSAVTRRRHPPWFVALPTRSCSLSCYSHNPITNKWHLLPLDNTISPVKPVSTIGGLILLRITTTTSLQLAICNPFTKQFRTLPKLNVRRTNPAVGVVESSNSAQKDSILGFKIFVAGGMSEAASGGAVYQPTIEVYDSFLDRWTTIGAMPVEFAVRLTVWTPNESVHSNGVLYWMTSARAYSVMGFDISSNSWRELSVPMGDRLEFAALVPRNGELAVVGGRGSGEAWVWKLGGDGGWNVVGNLPFEMGIRFLGDGKTWGNVKCVGIEGAVCLYRDVGSGIIVWREMFGNWEWVWIEGCCSIRGKLIQNSQIRGFLIHPNLAHSLF